MNNESFDLDDEFELFMRKAYPHVESWTVQYLESRRVFMAGAAVLLDLLQRVLPTLSNEDGCKQLEATSSQLQDFFQKRVGFTD